MYTKTFHLVIFGDGYEYEVERDQQTLFSRPIKDRPKKRSWDQGKTAAKRRKLEIMSLDEPLGESDVESSDGSDEGEEMVRK